MIFAPGFRGKQASVQLFASNTGSGATITMPSGISSGMLGVIFNSAQKDIPEPASVVPAGFTSLSETSASPFADRATKSIVSAKILNGSETTLTGMTGGVGAGQYTAWIVLVFSGTFASITANSVNAATGNGVSAQTIDFGGTAVRPLIAIGQMASNATAWSQNISPAMSAVGDAANHQIANYKIYNVGDAVTNISYAWTARGDTDVSQSMYLSF